MGKLEKRLPFKSEGHWEEEVEEWGSFKSLVERQGGVFEDGEVGCRHMSTGWCGGARLALAEDIFGLILIIQLDKYPGGLFPIAKAELISWSGKDDLIGLIGREERLRFFVKWSQCIEKSHESNVYQISRIVDNDDKMTVGAILKCHMSENRNDT